MAVEEEGYGGGRAYGGALGGALGGGATRRCPWWCVEGGEEVEGGRGQWAEG